MFAREMYPSPVWIVNQNRNFNNIINGSIASLLSFDRNNPHVLI